ncbi:MAG: AAA family ATPase [Pseudomonadota bacterium]
MLIEREDQLAQLIEIADSANDGRGAIVLISGEAGIGKTSMLEEFRLRASGPRKILWGGCDALFTPRPLGPLHDMAHQFVPHIKMLLSQHTPSGQLFSEILNTIEDELNGSVLIFEDAHWADHATLDFLKYIGRRIAILPVMIAISFRSDEILATHPLREVLGDLPSAYVKRMELAPLSREGVKLLGTPPGYTSDDLYDVTGGNPFFVTELIAGADYDNNDIPASVKDAVAARLNRLGQSERGFLETISLFPGVVPRHVLDPLFGAEGETLAMACVGRGLLMQNVKGELRFRHELARLATLARLSVAKQKQFHGAILSALQEGDSTATLDQLVHHSAGALDGKRVLNFAPKAAARAASVGAHREAAAHYRTALRFVDEADSETAATLYENWAYEAGLALQIDDEVIDARRHAVTLWRALGRADKVGDNLRWLSRLHWYRGEAAEAGRFADEAVRVLDNAEPSHEKAMAYSLRSQLHMLNFRMDEAIDWGERAMALAEQFDDDEVKIHALNNIGTALIFQNKGDGVAKLEESLKLAIAHGHHEHVARVYTNLSEYAVEFRKFDLAEKTIADGIAFDTQHDLDSWTHYLVGRLAQLRLEQGRFRDAETIAEGVLSLDRLTLLMKLPALLVLARARVRLGDDNAQETLEQAIQSAAATDEPQYIVPAHLAYVEWAWLNEKRTVASQHLEPLVAFGVSKMHEWNRGEAAILAHRMEIVAPADFIADLPKPYAEELANDAEAASNTWLNLGAPYPAALALLHAAQSEADATRLCSALKILEPMEAAATNLAREKARAFGVSAKMPRFRRGPNSSARNHPLGLTAREQQILVLISTGATNKEIASSLSRSHRTIEHHVSSVLTKLNVTSRMEAMLRVQNEPWLIPKSLLAIANSTAD